MSGRLKGLTANSRIVLYSMCVNAHDNGTRTIPPGIYFRGWEHLARMLGHEGLTVAGHRAVARALVQLQEAGLIERDDYLSEDRRFTSYRLTL